MFPIIILKVSDYQSILVINIGDGDKTLMTEKKKKKKEFSFSRVRGIKQLDELSKNYQVLCHKLISSQHS